MYDYVIVTHIPVFYKVNLYNELSKKLNIFVIFISGDTNEKRADDFVSLENAEFRYEVLSEGDFQNRNQFANIRKIKDIIKNIEYKKLLVSGWELGEFWYLVFFYPKSKNCLALESTVLESSTVGIKRVIKKLFLSRISTVFASGALHVELLNALGYKSEIKVTKGVGIINKTEFARKEKRYQKRFLYIGRLSKVKNLKTLIELFNSLEECFLTIIGDGEEKEVLAKMAKSNIIFKEPIENKKLKDEFLNNDIFILPSVIEPWGLVIEEALYFGLPVIVSQNCGSVELIKNGVNGYIFDPKDSKNLKDIIINIDAKRYDELLAGVEEFSIDDKDRNQISSYI
ncbi:MAG: glycosyltransferase [Sulfurimonas sp.]|uniref:glycosyltransferase n=1 Tax=Sulfurimonas sp. TaxID=2022749 RepID=UPI00260ED2E7|nr:glycosyltransferase [Sulfurimonas sp.]MDD5400390.1 glycosyltransferase [Sulfurimonas sp.]